jgi:hypothetical protein
VRKTDFRQWDDATAFETTQRKEEAEKEKFERNLKDAVDSGPDFDEEWEQCLYRICYHNLRYRNRVTDISRLLNFIKDDLLQEFDENLGDAISDVLGETAVTSVNTTDESQSTLPERTGKGKRRKLENFEMWLVDMNEQNGSSDEEARLINALHEDMKKEFPEASHSFHRDWSAFLNKHKFFAFLYAGKGFQKKGSRLGLTAHHRTDYRLPNIQGVQSARGRNFQRGKYSSARYHQNYRFKITSFEEYEKNRDSIMDAIRASADMMTDENYPKRLKITYSEDESSFQSFDSNAHNIGDRGRVEELCEEYLSPNYKQS